VIFVLFFIAFIILKTAIESNKYSFLKMISLHKNFAGIFSCRPCVGRGKAEKIAF